MTRKLHFVFIAASLAVAFSVSVSSSALAKEPLGGFRRSSAAQPRQGLFFPRSQPQLTQRSWLGTPSSRSAVRSTQQKRRSNAGNYVDGGFWDSNFNGVMDTIEPNYGGAAGLFW